MAVDCMDSSTYVSKILSERRKAKKPLMEKLRRARINDSLNELKVLVLELLNKDASRYSKMEKADILEMTVGYLRAAQRNDKRVLDINSVAEFRAGFNQCAAEVSRNLGTTENSEHLREKLLSHLASSCHGNHASQSVPSATVWVPYPSPPPSPTGQTAIFLPGPVAVQRELVRPLSPVSPCEAPRMNFNQTLIEAVVLKPVEKTALWRPW